MRISQRSIEDVRQTTNIVEVASEFTALRRQGARFSGLCPYPDHDEKTPSFSVSPDRGFYYCFGCQRGGDAIKLVTELKSLSFTESVSYLAERSGVELEFEGSSEDSREFKERSLKRRNIHRALAAAAVYYHKYLLKAQTPAVRRGEEVPRKTGIRYDSTIEEFRLGYAPPRGQAGLVEAVRRLDLGRDVLDAAGLLSSRGGERFAGRITFPISDRRGRIVGFGARALGDDQPKYLNSPETSVFNKRELLYGFPQVAEAIRKERSALVVEGYTDVLMLYQSGIKNAVATLGTATTPNHLKTLSSYADRIHVLFDPDAAGEKAVERAATTAADLKLDLRVLRLSEDPADWLSAHDAREFANLLSKAVPILKYIFSRKADSARGADSAGRARAVTEIKQLLTEIEDPVFYNDAVRLATEALGVSREVLEEKRARPGRRNSRSRAFGSRSLDPHAQAGRELLAMALTRPDLAKTLLREGIATALSPDPLKLSPGDFAEETQSRVFELLEENAGEDLDAVFLDERARPLIDHIAAFADEGERLYPSEATVQESWLRLAILSRQRAKRETQDLDIKEQLQNEIQTLKDALRSVVAEP